MDDVSFSVNRVIRKDGEVLTHPIHEYIRSPKTPGYSLNHPPLLQAPFPFPFLFLFFSFLFPFSPFVFFFFFFLFLSFSYFLPSSSSPLAIINTTSLHSFSLLSTSLHVQSTTRLPRPLYINHRPLSHSPSLPKSDPQLFMDSNLRSAISGPEQLPLPDRGICRRQGKVR